MGEALVDFIPAQTGVPLRDVAHYERTIGGAPANVTVGLARQGVPVGLLTRVGDDEFGRFLAAALHAEGVDTSRFIFDEQRRTGITFLQIDASGERSFLFFRMNSAEMGLSVADLNAEYLRGARIVHLGSNTMMRPEGWAATLEAATIANEAGHIVSTDPNLRVHMWPSTEACCEAAQTLIRHAQIVKLNDDEAALVTQQQDPIEAAQVLSSWGPSLAVVTQGERGCVWRGRWGEGSLPAVTVQTVDTTGAGDAFVAGMLAVFARSEPNAEGDFAPETVHEAMTTGVALGAAAVTQVGATTGVPMHSGNTAE